MAQRILGLDLGTWSVKAAVLESSLRRFQLVDFVEHHLPRDATGRSVEGELAAAVRATLTATGDPDSVATAVPGRRVLTRELDLPFTDDKRIASVLAFQLESHLPIPIDELVVDYHALERSDEGSKLLCSAVRREYLEGLLDDLQGVGADPKVVSLDTLSYGQLLAPLGLAEEDEGAEGKARALIDVGHMSTSVCITVGSDVRYVRSIARGGHHITTALMKAYDLDYAQAEALKHEGIRLDGFAPPGVDDDEHAERVQIVAKALAPIVRDVRMTIHGWTHKSRRLLDEALLFGGSTRMPGLADAVAQGVDVPVTKPRLSTAEWAKLDDDGTSDVDKVGPKAAALAFRYRSTAGADDLNFRQGDLAYESDFKILKDRAPYMVAFLVLALGLFFGRQVVQLGLLEEQHAALVDELKGFSQQVLGEEKDDFEFVLKRLAQKPDGEQEDVFPKRTAFRTFYEVTQAQERVNEMAPGSLTGGPARKADDGGGEADGGVGGGGEAGAKADPERPRPKGDDGDGAKAPGPEGEDAPPASGGGGGGAYRVELKQVQIDLKNAYVKGEANGIEAVEALSTELGKHPCFPEVETQDTTRISFGKREDWLRFQLKIAVLCEEPKQDADTRGEGSKVDEAAGAGGAGGAGGGEAEGDE